MRTECISEFVSFNDKTYSCPISVAMNLVGGKWKTFTTFNTGRSASANYETISCQQQMQHSLISSNSSRRTASYHAEPLAISRH